MTRTKRFEGIVRTVHQDGTALTPISNGVNVQLHWNPDDAETPRCAEVFSDNGAEHAEIGLGWLGKKLIDYDGVFDLPVQVMDFLDELGFDTQEMRSSLV
jgi:hypothetical protein